MGPLLRVVLLVRRRQSFPVRLLGLLRGSLDRVGQVFALAARHRSPPGPSPGPFSHSGGTETVRSETDAPHYLRHDAGSRKIGRASCRVSVYTERIPDVSKNTKQV